jgi:hypothetical protein
LIQAYQERYGKIRVNREPIYTRGSTAPRSFHSRRSFSRDVNVPEGFERVDEGYIVPQRPKGRILLNGKWYQEEELEEESSLLNKKIDTWLERRIMSVCFLLFMVFAHIVAQFVGLDSTGLWIVRGMLFSFLINFIGVTIYIDKLRSRRRELEFIHS